MKTISIRIRILLGLAVCLLASLFVFWFTDPFCLRGYLSYPKLGPPDYITEVWPLPGSELLVECYAQSLFEHIFSFNTRGIFVRINSDQVAALLMPKTNHIIKSRFYNWVSLYIDDILIPNSTLEYGCACTAALLQLNGKPYPFDLDIGGVKSLSWAPPLTFGDHAAKLVIAIPDVEPLEYEWHFRIK